jgi:hypothetical protein
MLRHISDCDCPDCAPYCSSDGSCWQSPDAGSTPCENRECYTDDDCYLTPDVYMSLRGRQGCFTYSGSCQEYTCSYVQGPGFCTGANAESCVLFPDAIGDDCSTMRAECEEEKRQKLAAGEPATAICGTAFVPLKQLTAAAGVSLQVGSKRGSWSTSTCGSGRCRTRTGRCCEPVWVKTRSICPLYC